VTYINMHRTDVAFSGEDATDFVLRQPGVGEPHDPRAIGSLFRKAAKQKRIQRSSVLFRRRKGNGTMTLGWVAI
jgi:hypothetical protein